MKEFVLKVAQRGFAAGKAFPVGAADEKEDVPGGYAAGTPEEELHRFDEAVRVFGEELAGAAAAADEDSAAIFKAEKVLLEDEWYAGAVRQLIRAEGLDAPAAVRKTGTDLARELRASENAYLQQRSDDVKGVTDRLLALLRGGKERALTAPSILAAEELSPAQLSGMDVSLIRGIVTAKGGPLSHVSILAGNLGIPYVYGSREAAAAACACSRLILAGDRLILDPEEEMYAQALRRQEELAMRKGKRAADRLGSRTRVCASISGAVDTEALRTSGADGVGLCRTEFLFPGHTAAPSEEEQTKVYRAIAEAMGERETVFRTMDLGADKNPGWLALPEEKNPALGCRGVRVSLKERDFFKTQLRAMLRAAVSGNLKIMIPMVTSVWEVEAVRACLEECAKELAEAGTAYRMPSLGIMVETPAAALTAEQLAEKADFFSIGTNDLTQYTLALDREAQGLEAYDAPCYEVVLKLVCMTAEAGRRKHIPTAVCGELAGSPAAVKRLIAAGIEALSVPLPKLAETRRLVRKAEEELRQFPDQRREVF